MVLSQTTLGELYASLSTDEIKGLDLYLQKNTVGRQNTLILLHRFFCDARLAKQLEKLDTDTIKAELFGGDSKSVSKLTTYNNLLINHIKDFLLLSKIHEKNIYTETLWGEILIERRLRRNLLLKLTNFKFDLYKDSYALMKSFFNAREKFYYNFLNLTKKNYEKLVKSQIEHIESYKVYVDFYLIESYNTLISFADKINYKLSNSDDLQRLLEIKVNAKADILSIQSLSLNLTILQSKEAYLELKQFFIDRLTFWSIDTCIQMIPILYNYGHRQVNKGNEIYEKENYNFLNAVEKKKLLFTKGIFSIPLFINFVRLELIHGTIEKAEQLLEESLKVIAPGQRDSFKYLIESRISFAKKEYKLSLRKISIINPSDSIYYFPQYKIMLIKNYIMLADIDRLMAERENFYKYLNNQKNIQEDEKRRHKLFIKYTEYLTNARYEYLTDYMKKRIENALLQTSPYFSEKLWVRERWEELKGN
jgi:hypothetical protein